VDEAARQFVRAGDKRLVRLVYDELVEHARTRGVLPAHGQLWERKAMIGCDYHVTPRDGKAFIVEFDESQHFTYPRLLTLHRTSSRRVAYTVDVWRERCRTLDRRDPDPPHRDERRAWLDFLRDVMPRVSDMAPTRRVFPDQTKPFCQMHGNQLLAALQLT
jgi:hypothetical protein